MEMKDRLRLLREETKLTIEELSKMLDVSPNSIEKWENGGEISSDNLVKYSDFFNVSIEFIIKGVAIPTTSADGKPLSDDEQKFLYLMRLLNDAGKEEFINRILKAAKDNNDEKMVELTEELKKSLLKRN